MNQIKLLTAILFIAIIASCANKKNETTESNTVMVSPISGNCSGDLEGIIEIVEDSYKVKLVESNDGFDKLLLGIKVKALKKMPKEFEFNALSLEITDELGKPNNEIGNFELSQTSAHNPEDIDKIKSTLKKGEGEAIIFLENVCLTGLEAKERLKLLEDENSEYKFKVQSKLSKNAKVKTKKTFGEFFVDFQNAIKNNDYEAAAGMIMFPLEGMTTADWESISTKSEFKRHKVLSRWGDFNKITFEGINKNYSPVYESIDGGRLETTCEFSGSVSDYGVNRRGTNDNVIFSVNRTFTSAEDRDEGSYIYIFGRKGDEYKLIEIMIIG